MTLHLLTCPPRWAAPCRMTAGGAGDLIITAASFEDLRVLVTTSDTVPTVPVRSGLKVRGGGETSLTLTVANGDRVWIASESGIGYASVEAAPAMTTANALIVTEEGVAPTDPQRGDVLHIIGPVGEDGGVWRRGGSPIAGATQTSYTVSESDAGATITATATNAAGAAVTVAGSHAVGERPTVTGSLPDVSVLVGAATVTVNAAAVIGGGAVDTWTVRGPATINGSGVVSIATDKAFAGQIVTVIARNAYGSARVGFTASVQRPAGTDAPWTGWGGLPDAPPPPPPPPADPVGAILADGWQWAPVEPALSDPPSVNGGSPSLFSVTRAGFDDSGNATTRTFTPAENVRVRKPYGIADGSTLNSPAYDAAPNVSLTAFIYSGDVVTKGGAPVTNNSAVAPERVVGQWITGDYKRYTQGTGDLVVEFEAYHCSMRDSKPAGWAQARLTDGANTITAVAVCDKGPAAYSASGLNPPRYRATFTQAALATLNEGVATLHAKVRPYAGPEWDTETHGVAHGAITGWSPQRVVIDAGTMHAYAMVDVTNGTTLGADTSQVTTTRAAAEAKDGTANAYASIADAAQALQSWFLANRARDDAGGGVVILSASAPHPQPDIDNRVTTIAPLYIDDVSGGGAQVVSALTAGTTLPSLIIYDGVDVDIANDQHLFFAGKAGGYIEMANGALTNTGAGVDIFLTNNGGRLRFTNVAGAANLPLLGSTNRALTIRMVGCTNLDHNNLHWAFASAADKFTIGGQNVDRPNPIGPIVSFCRPMNTANCIEIQCNAGIEGIAIVGNVVEYIGAEPAGAAPGEISTNSTEIRNMIFVGNTVPVEKVNFNYTDNAGDSAIKYASLAAYNLVYAINTKTDIHAASPDAIGGWPSAFRVNFERNAYTHGDDQTDGYGAGRWLGEAPGVGDMFGTNATPLVPNFVDYQAGQGGTGGGNYTPQVAPGVLPQIPAGRLPYPCDLYGTAFANDGTAVVGAMAAVAA